MSQALWGRGGEQAGQVCEHSLQRATHSPELLPLDPTLLLLRMEPEAVIGGTFARSPHITQKGGKLDVT